MPPHARMTIHVYHPKLCRQIIEKPREFDLI